MMLPSHPYADLFPLVDGSDYDVMVGDIREQGILDPIVLLDNQILDGRNRFNVLMHLVESGEVLGPGWGHRAGANLDAAALEPDNIWFRKFNPNVDGSPLEWVLSKNLARRHLNDDGRASVAAKLSNLTHGGDRSKPPIGGMSVRIAAERLNVARRQVERMRVVHSDGVQGLRSAADKGTLPASVAETIARLPHDEQESIVAKGEKEILAAAKEIRARDRRVRFEEVNGRLAEISEASKPLPTGQRFPIILADPATRYVSGFSNRSIENHYPTMPVEELCALPVNALATDSAVLFVWTTIPQLRNTMRFIEAWGFNYVSAWCWDKVDQGTGHWAFNQHEELLIATRGDFPAPVPGMQPRSIYTEKKAGHSAKPDWFAEQIERIWPKLPKIELFARDPRPGWVVWGNQSGSDDSDHEAA